MSTITDFIKYELYPSLFENIDKALPEHDFKKFIGGWRSKTYLNGNKHKDRLDKLVVTKKAPNLIMEQGGEVVPIIDYVIKRDNTDFIGAVKTLANVVGLSIPVSTEYNNEEYIKYKQRNTILETCNNYFIYCLENSTGCLLYTSPSPRDRTRSRMPSSA